MVIVLTVNYYINLVDWSIMHPQSACPDVVQIDHDTGER